MSKYSLNGISFIALIMSSTRVSIRSGSSTRVMLRAQSTPVQTASIPSPPRVMYLPRAISAVRAAAAHAVADAAGHGEGLIRRVPRRAGIRRRYPQYM